MRVSPTLNEAQFNKIEQLAQMQGITPNQLTKRLVMLYLAAPEKVENLFGETLSKAINTKKPNNDNSALSE